MRDLAVRIGRQLRVAVVKSFCFIGYIDERDQ